MARRREYRRQPVHDALRERGVTVTQVAAVAGIGMGNASHMLAGRLHPSERLVAAAELLTGLPRERLFDPDVLRRRNRWDGYGGPGGGASGVTPGGDAP